jgi:hypothetical protein
MTTDERIAALVERHESLTHAVELLAQIHKDNEKQSKLLTKDVRAFVRAARNWMFDLDSRLRDLEAGGDEDEEGGR